MRSGNATFLEAMSALALDAGLMQPTAPDASNEPPTFGTLPDDVVLYLVPFVLSDAFYLSGIARVCSSTQRAVNAHFVALLGAHCNSGASVITIQRHARGYGGRSELARSLAQEEQEYQEYCDAREQERQEYDDAMEQERDDAMEQEREEYEASPEFQAGLQEYRDAMEQERQEYEDMVQQKRYLGLEYEGKDGGQQSTDRATDPHLSALVVAF